MPDRTRRWLLDVLRVPAEPLPPPGDPRLVRTFRAAHNYFRYRVMLWALTQVGAAAGIFTGYLVITAGMRVGVDLWIWAWLERLVIMAFVIQIPFSFALLRLDFEMRWYMLSDRSLRIREGTLVVGEQTMTFANIQNIVIRQNPLQRLFGIADVTVRAAGGGSSTQQGGRKTGSAGHEASFNGVDNAEVIRDVIRDRIRQYRDAGLGDPDAPESAALTAPAVRRDDALAAARELLAEVRLMRKIKPAGA